MYRPSLKYHRFTLRYRHHVAATCINTVVWEQRDKTVYCRVKRKRAAEKATACMRKGTSQLAQLQDSLDQLIIGSQWFENMVWNDLHSSHPCSSPYRPSAILLIFKIDPVNFSNERSEPMAVYRDAGCNPSRPAIYLPCSSISNQFRCSHSRLQRSFMIPSHPQLYCLLIDLLVTQDSGGKIQPTRQAAVYNGSQSD